MKSTEEVLLEQIARMFAQLDRMERWMQSIGRPKRSYSEKEAAEFLGISVRYLQELRASRKIAFKSHGGGKRRAGRITYSADALAAYEKSRERNAV